MSSRMIALLTTFGLLLLPMATTSGTIVVIKNRHASIDIPDGWTYQRDLLFQGVRYDVVMAGVSTDPDSPYPYGTLNVFHWPSAISNSTLYSWMKELLQGIQIESSISNLTLVNPPSNITLSGELANLCTFTFFDAIDKISTVLLAVSDDWTLGYALIFFDELSQWSADSQTFQSVQESLKILPRDGISFSILVLIFATTGLAVVVSLAFLWRRRRRKVFYKFQLVTPSNPQPPGHL